MSTQHSSIDMNPYGANNQFSGEQGPAEQMFHQGSPQPPLGSQMQESSPPVQGQQIAMYGPMNKSEAIRQMVVDLERGTKTRNVDVRRYRSLHKAIRKKNWKAVADFVADDPGALTADITEFGDNIFHLLIEFEEANDLVGKFVSQVDAITLESTNVRDYTALVIAAIHGNTEAAKLLVEKNKNLLTLKLDMEKVLPVHVAVWYSRKKTVEYLLSETAQVVDLISEGGACLLNDLLKSNLFGVALNLMKQYPVLATVNCNKYWKRNLQRMARKPLLFASGVRLGFWQKFVYKYVPLQEEKSLYSLSRRVSESSEKIIKSSENNMGPSKLLHKLNIIIWNGLMHLVPSIRHVYEKKLMHAQIRRILKMMLEDFTPWNYTNANDFLKDAILTAATVGTYEIVDEILKVYKDAASFMNEEGHTILSLAVLNRHEEIFNLVYQVSDPMVRDATKPRIESGYTILHLAGSLVPSSEIPGAALQMQRELQWFQMIEGLFHPSLQGKHDDLGNTPRELFSANHAELVNKGEKWMKDTATACSLVAALIITVVFAAIFTVPGGLNNDGGPIFFYDISFKIFAISIALALFSSTASVQMFLGILTSRYAEEDFLYSLPKKLMTGLMALFFSIASMMVAFAATFSILISHPWRWATLLIASLATVPVTLFAWMQFPLLVDIYNYTYGVGLYKPIKNKDVYM